MDQANLRLLEQVLGRSNLYIRVIIHNYNLKLLQKSLTLNVCLSLVNYVIVSSYQVAVVQFSSRIDY